MVNYKRIVCEVAVLTAVLAVAASAPTPECKDHEHHAHYDMRQNGSENYRLSIDGVVIAVAPADSLLSAASDIDFNDLFDLDELSEYTPKPPKPSEDKPPKPLVEPKPQEGKPQDLKPEQPVKPQELTLSDISLTNDVQGQKKDAGIRKQQKAQRLKNRLASILVPLLRKTRHH